MVFAEEIRKIILKLADQKGPAESFSTSEVAKRVDPDNWQNLMDQVHLVAHTLMSEGKIVAVPTSRKLQDSPEQINLRKKV